MAIIHLRAAGTSLVLDGSGDGLPRVLHWGADLGEVDETDLEALALAQRAPQVSNTLDDAVPLALLPEHAAGWLGTPGLSVHRDGTYVDPPRSSSTGWPSRCRCRPRPGSCST